MDLAEALRQTSLPLAGRRTNVLSEANWDSSADRVFRRANLHDRRSFLAYRLGEQNGLPLTQGHRVVEVIVP